MLRMRRISQVLSAAAVAAFAVTAANATITVQFVKVTASPTATTGAAIYAANGWSPWLLVATADATSGTVGGWDVSTPVSTPQAGTSNNTSHDWGIFAITGSIGQRWAVDPDAGTTTPTNTGTTPALVGSTPWSASIAASPDSFFFTSGTFAQATAPAEDNNLANGTGPNQNPVPDNLGGNFNTGVGTFMKAAGTVQTAGQVQSQVIAQVWLPNGANVTAFGVVTDGTSQANKFNFQASTSTAVIPEPASIGALMIGGLALLARRRRA